MSFSKRYAIYGTLFCHSCVNTLSVNPQVEQIRQSIDKMEANVKEVDKIHSTILSSPQNDDSMCPPAVRPLNCLNLITLIIFATELKQQLEDLMADIKRTAQRVRTNLKGIHLSSASRSFLSLHVFN